ncbi:DUF1015 family protein [Methanomassiliicoccus luminyensis]|jgi:uncharacterized protein (DUF1015 family)|uniref:DUF1015 family protein n=1 Tax=Methanomassiliicoccus luminyensis TaxID=1080712 RepID=UPI00036AAC59|nr:DUF1015 domain-containing protein [Methanomassiliicoccus luminyensis]
MVDFQPFRGFVPALDKDEGIGERVSPPYDIISPAELKRYQSHRYNITRITLGGVDGKYVQAAEELDSWISSGKLVQDEAPCYYIYRQSFQDRGKWLVRNGIIGALRAEGYEAGNIIPHEETFPKVKEDRLNLLRATATHCESIFGLFDRSEIDLNDVAKTAGKLFEHTDASGTVHELYRISDRETVDAIRKMLRGKRILIADGHHRYETSYRYSQENPGDERKAYVLCTMVSSQDTGMFVRPTHRMVRNLKVNEGELLDSLAAQFSVRELKDVEEMNAAMAAAKEPTFGIILPSGEVVVARFTAPPEDILWTVDTYVGQEVLLKCVQRALPPDEELDLVYDHDLGSVEKQVRAGEAGLGIAVRAPSLDQTWEVAMAGRKMPKKTTYFWPKIWSGFVLYRMK